MPPTKYQRVVWDQLLVSDEQKPIVIDIASAFATLQQSPELVAAMTELVGGPALVAAQDAADTLLTALRRIADGLVADPQEYAREVVREFDQ